MRQQCNLVPLSSDERKSEIDADVVPLAQMIGRSNVDFVTARQRRLRMKVRFCVCRQKRLLHKVMPECCAKRAPALRADRA